MDTADVVTFVRLSGFVLLMWVFSGWLPSVEASPFIPTDDAQVLERLRINPIDPQARELRKLRDDLTRDPNNINKAVHLSKRYIEYGRAEADPRYTGYAQAALSPWWGLQKPPSEILLLRATIRQSQHDFEGALADLSLSLSTDPTNPQTWLTRALILQIQGHFEEAKRNCVPLLRLTSPLVAATCISGAGSLSGQADTSYNLLRNHLHQADHPSPDEQVWVLTLLAEIATRTGKTKLAEAHFKKAFDLGVRDSYLLGAYADFLLDENRPAEVVSLLKDETRADGLLLRLALAEQALRAPTLSDRIVMLRARFEASRLRQDMRHQREEARFTLKLRKKPHEALTLAQTNWAIQREPWDARILLESALSAHNPLAAKPVLDWLVKTKLEDVQLAKLVEKFKGP